YRFLFLAGLGYLVIGIGVFIAANLCASLSRRDKTEELFATLPLRTEDRTAARLLFLAFPLLAAVVIAGILAMTTRPWEGALVRLDGESRTLMQGVPDFGQGP